MKSIVLTVVVCAVFDWRLGGVWYGLLFTQHWMTLENMTEAQTQGFSRGGARPRRRHVSQRLERMDAPHAACFDTLKMKSSRF